MRPRILHMTATAALLVGLSFSPMPAFAQATGDFEKGVEAFDIGKYKEAMALWQPLADDGNVEALRNMAQLYRLGLGVQQDDAKAFELYEEAAERGLAAAQVNAAFLLLTGKGVERDRAAAATWFAKAADQGDPLAQYNLGLMYEKGIGVRKNDEFALELYRLAADQGQRRAIARLDALDAAAATAEAETAAAGSDEAKSAAETAEKAPTSAEADAKSADADAETAEKVSTAAETDVPDEKTPAEVEYKAPALLTKPITADPLEFEANEKANSPDATSLPSYKPSATDNPDQDTRPIVNVTRTPTRKPGEVDPDAAQGDEPLVITIPSETDGTDVAKTEDGAPTPAYVQTYTAENIEETPPAEVAEGDDGAPTPAYVQTYSAEKEPDTGSAAMADAKTPASISTTEMRAPNDPVARVKMAETAYRSGDYANAAALLGPLSDAGMPVAQFWMGRLYNRGEGVDLNRAEAYSLWRSAAAGGSNRAATALANLASRLSPDEIAYAEQQHAMSGRAR